MKTVTGRIPGRLEIQSVAPPVGTLARVAYDRWLELTGRVCPTPGTIHVVADYSHIEFRILASLRT